MGVENEGAPRLPRQVSSDGFEPGPTKTRSGTGGRSQEGERGRLSIANARTLESTPPISREKNR
jgi:hypothetical protein